MSSQSICKSVSAALVLCMIVSSALVMISAPSSAGTVYQSPVGFVDGNETAQNLGKSVALIDLNLDGLSDLVVGAPYTTAGGLPNSGSVTVYLSKAGVAMDTLMVINGTHESELFGWAVANVEDVDGDGDDDLAVGAIWADPGGLSHAGNITIFSSWAGFDGTRNATITGLNAGEELGFSIAAAGDINGDGTDDILAGAPWYSSTTLSECGRAYVFYGGNPLNSIADKTFAGEAAGAHLGWSVSGAGSVDADADLDMIAGAPDQGTSGAAYLVRDLIRANPSVTVINGKSLDENFSFSVSMIPDINGDTITDLAIGAPTNNNNGSHAGAVYVLYGGSKFNTVPDMTLVGSPNEWFGWAVAAGDFHEDGVSDLLVGAPNSNLNASSIGRAYAYFGSSAPSGSANVTLVPDIGASFFGASLAVGENITGDGAPDFAVGDFLFNLPGTPNAGRVYLYAGTHVIIPANPVVKGYVYVPGTTQGIQGFTVTLESGLLEKSTVTNSAGFYQLTAVPGTFWLNASRTGYVSNSSSVTLVMNDEITMPPFYPLKTPLIMGVVRDAVSGTLLQGESVAMFDEADFVQKMVTGANGTYWFYLPDSLVPPVGSSATVDIAAWDAARYTSNSSVDISRNQTVWLNFTLDRFPVVSGTVREALGLSAVRGALVQANQGDVILASTTTDVRGQYTIVATNTTPGQALFINITADGYFRTNQSVIAEENGTYTLNFILQRDNAPPTSQLSSLGTYTITPAVPIDATASDANGIQEVQLWYRYGESGTYSMYSSDSDAPFTFSFDPSTANGDGIYSFYSRAVDYAGNVESAPANNDTWTFSDSHPPALVINQPAPDHLYGSSTVLIQWLASDSGSGIANFGVRLDLGAWTDCGMLPFHSFTSVSDGPHNVTINATDVAGLATLGTVPFRVDTVGPVSDIVNNAQYTDTPNITVTASASDDNGIEEVQLWYRFGGAGSYTCIGIDDEGLYEFEVNSSDLEGDGLYEFYSVAVDGAGNNETPPTSPDFSTIVDTSPPEAMIDFPSTSGVVGSDSFQVNWTAEDISGISTCWARLDGGDWTTDLTSSCTLNSLSEGNHTVEVRVFDHAGHNSTVSSSFMVDTYSPMVTITSPENGTAFSGYAVQIVWSASDNGSGLETVTVSKDGMNWVPIDLKKSDYTFAGTLMNVDGAYTLYVRAIDNAGHSTIESIGVFMDRSPPTLIITNPASGEKVKRTNLTLEWIMSDVVSGVHSVRVSLDGGPFTNAGLGDSWELRDLAEGQHNVTIRATDGAGNTREVGVTFTVAPGGGISTLMIAGIALVVIAVVAIAALMIRRRGPVQPKDPGAKGKS